MPLGGRIVRGFVVGSGHDSDRLKEVRSISGAGPVFGRRLLEVMRWAAHYYVAPLSVMLARAAPPNLPATPVSNALRPLATLPSGPLTAVAEAARQGRHLRPHYLLTPEGWTGRLSELVEPVLAADRSVLAIAPTGAELRNLAEALGSRLGERLVAVAPDASARDTTIAWSRAASLPGLLVAGTPRVLLWPVAALSLAVVLDEGRRALKERQTPTLHVRDVLARRAAIERLALAFFGQVPTTEVVASGTAVVRPSGRPRAWPLVEIVDRRQEPPDAGLLGERVRAALREAVRSDWRVLLFSHRHGYSAAARCVRCRRLRVCHECGARPDPGPVCRRCGAPLGPCTVCGGASFAPLGAGVGRVTEDARRLMGTAGRGRLVAGTERDLAGAAPFDLAVVVDADGLILGTNYRAAEEALRVMVRVATAVRGGRGRRAMVQTVMPDHRVIQTLAKGDPLPFLRDEVDAREMSGLPPSGELIVIETVDEPDSFDAKLRSAVGEAGSVLGPAQGIGRRRWLVQGRSLARAKQELRILAQHARDSGARVRIDVDPIDL